jgi:ubiquinone/menaquinone biosynthesis C-methylase UbiE
MSGAMQKTDKTAKTYGYLWKKETESNILPDSHHYDRLQGVVPISIVEGMRGIDAGCGNGYDLRLMASQHPGVTFVGLDVSDGIYGARKNCEGLPNVYFVKASLLALPFKEDSFDCAYSYGVIHHTPRPDRCFRELGRILRTNAPCTVSLYEKHEENPMKHAAVSFVSLVRALTVRMPKRLLYAMCLILSPVVFILFTVPARLFGLFKKTHPVSEAIPFNFAKTPFSLVGDLYDRFGAPIEHRFSKDEILRLFGDASFREAGTTKLKDTAGWIGWGRAS